MNIRHKQNGAVMILVVVGMVAMLAVVGLALDGGHAMLNKTRLQNAVDAAALSGAKELDLSSDSLTARTAARLAFTANGAASGNKEMGEAYADGTISLDVQFSSTLNPFVPGTIPAEYVRVRARNFRMPAWFSTIVGITEMTVAATAVAGPSPTINVACNIAPMMVCGDPDPAVLNWGYTPGEPDVLKSNSVDGDIGPGNFQLIRLGGGQGARVVREGMAGNYDGCIASGDPIETEPGNTVGPVGQGLNTRFGIYDGSMKGEELTYPADVITQQPDPILDCGVTVIDGKAEEDCNKIVQGTEPISSGDQLSYNYEDYIDDLTSSRFDNMPPTGQYQRRVVAVPVGNCSGSTNGQGQVPLLGFSCYFLLQEVGKGSEGSKVFGQFIESCNAGGVPGAAPGNAPGLYIIQLYKDPDSLDS